MTKPLGLTEPQLKEIEDILGRALMNIKTYKIFYFGSRARGDFKKYSDLDLWIESAAPLENQTLNDLHESFSESELPIKVDIVTPVSVFPAYKGSITKELRLWLEK